MRTVVGLDLSLASTGVATLHQDRRVTVQRVISKPAGRTLADKAKRVDALAGDIAHLCKGALLVVVEGPSLGQARQSGEHHRAGLWWMVVCDLAGWGIPVAEVPPATLKKYATGKGNAAKDQVLAAVIRRYPQVEVTGNDEADALALAAMGADHLGRPIVDMPAHHRTALAKVAWPAPEGVPA